MAFTLPLSYQAKSSQPQVMDEDFIYKEETEIMAFDLFKEPMILKMLGGNDACVTLAMATDKVCSHVRLLYITAKFGPK